MDGVGEAGAASGRGSSEPSRFATSASRERRDGRLVIVAGGMDGGDLFFNGGQRVGQYYLFG